MDTAIVVAIIAAAASLFAGALTFFFTKREDRESEWRKLCTEQYKELITAMSEVANPNPTDTARRRLALAENHVGLFSSPMVLRHLTRLLEAVRVGQTEHHDEILTDLIHAIRSDLSVPGAKPQSDIKFKLWAPGDRGSAT